MKAKPKHKRGRRRRAQESSPLTMLESELRSLHRDLRTIARAYIARLDIVRNRKLKPEKGRRKDLRKIDSLIVDLVSTIGQKN